MICPACKCEVWHWERTIDGVHLSCHVDAGTGWGLMLSCHPDYDENAGNWKPAGEG